MSPQAFLLCTSDPYTQVRNERGQLLGCVPRLSEATTGVRGNDGQPYLLRVLATSALCVPNNCNPTAVIPGFIPLDMGENADLALPPLPSAAQEEPA